MIKTKIVLVLSVLLMSILLFSGCNSGKEGAKDKEDKPAAATERKNTAAEHSSEESSKDSSMKAVVFEDPFFERYIRSYLGKGREEEILSEELSGIGELVIDRRFIETEVSGNSMATITLQRMDLSDLKYFTNLTKLDIQNDMNDIFYSLDAIGFCTKLEELSFAYGTTGSTVIMPGYRYATAYGYKTLYGILDQLPNLKKLEIGNTNSKFLTELQEKYPGIMITTDRAVQAVSYFKQHPGVITKVSELNNLPADTTIIHMNLDDGEDTNGAIQKAAEFEKLTVLRVAAPKGSKYDLAPLEKHGALEELALYGGSSLKVEPAAIQNEEVLTSIPKLRYLTFQNLALSDEILSSLKRLKTLSLSTCEIDGFRFLSSCRELYQLKLTGGSSSREDKEELKKEFIQGMESQRDLQYLSTEKTGTILSYCPEVVGQMTRLRDFTSIEADEGDYFKRLILSGCKDLKRVVLTSWIEVEGYDLSSLQGLRKLEVLWLMGSNQYDHTEVLSGLTNLQYIQLELGRVKLENILTQLEAMSQVLIKLPNISAAVFNHMLITAQIPLTPDQTEGVERFSKALYEEGIYELYYGFPHWSGKSVK